MWLGPHRTMPAPRSASASGRLLEYCEPPSTNRAGVADAAQPIHRDPACPPLAQRVVGHDQPAEQILRIGMAPVQIAGILVTAQADPAIAGFQAADAHDPL